VFGRELEEILMKGNGVLIDNMVRERINIKTVFIQVNSRIPSKMGKDNKFMQMAIHIMVLI